MKRTRHGSSALVIAVKGMWDNVVSRRYVSKSLGR